MAFIVIHHLGVVVPESLKVDVATCWRPFQLEEVLIVRYSVPQILSSCGAQIVFWYLRCDFLPVLCPLQQYLFDQLPIITIDYIVFELLLGILVVLVVLDGLRNFLLQLIW